jgi:hypothetical protein
MNIPHMLKFSLDTNKIIGGGMIFEKDNCVWKSESINSVYIAGNQLVVVVMASKIKN